MSEDNKEIDLEALQDNIDESQIDDSKTDENIDAGQEDEPEFSLDEALDSFEPISLDGKVTQEEAEEKATDRGWRKEGKDKFGHQISAIEFLERTPLFHKMDLMRGDIDKANKQIKTLAEQSKKIAQSKIDSDKKHIEDLKAQRESLLNTELMDADDIKDLKAIDKQIEEAPVSDLSESEDEIVARFEVAKDQFVEDNEWYNNNRAMTAVADKVGIDFAKKYFDKNGVMPEPDDTFNHVLTEVKKDFPDMGKPKRQTRVASNRNRSVVNNRQPKKTLSDLPEDQQAIARLVMESAELSEEEYLKSYEA